MAYAGFVFFFLAVAIWTVGIPSVVARCNVRNGLPPSYGWLSSLQYRRALRNFNKEDWRYFGILATSSLVFALLAIAFGFPGARA
jgi:hypothetical protein